MRPLTGRELNQQHKALIEAGMSSEFTLAWLIRETDLWILDRQTSTEGAQAQHSPTEQEPTNEQ